MRIIIVSGRSGSGKSSTLRLLEDLNFYCVDNVPADLIPALYKHFTPNLEKLAISIDARNIPSDVDQLHKILLNLQQRGANTEIIYLDAEDEALLKRFNETRRRHPLSNQQVSLKEAIAEEKKLLLPLAHLADLIVDTTGYNLYQLRETITHRINKKPAELSLLVQSFGFKFGVPIDSDYVFDARCLPNPYWHLNLRPYNGLDKPITEFLENFKQVGEFSDDVIKLLNTWIPRFQTHSRSYMTVSIGCTGGQHRSVYLAEKIYTYYKQQNKNVQIRHRELS